MNAIDINAKVVAKIQASGPQVEEAVIESLSSKEITRRVESLVKGFDQLETLNKDFKKIKPDIIVCDENKKPTSEGWSPKAADERLKHIQKTDKLQKAIEKGFGGEFGDLYNIIKGGGNAPADAAAPKTE